jgi:hypothetical protein
MTGFRLHEAEAIADAWLKDYDRYKSNLTPDYLVNEERMVLMLRLACQRIRELESTKNPPSFS